MKAAMLSIQPKWCELIASGKKTIEVRKTRPQLEMPFKCYIYCTASDVHSCLVVGGGETQLFHCCNYKTAFVGGGVVGNGKVIGEFVCDKIYDIKPSYNGYKINNNIALTNRIAKESCLQFSDLQAYLGTKNGYGWHISDLKIYDKPKELSEFKRNCGQYGTDNPLCDDCKYFIDGRSYEYDESDCAVCGHMPLTRPFQSWGYVEELN